MYNDKQQRQCALSQHQEALRPYQEALRPYQEAMRQYQEAKSLFEEGEDAEAKKLYEHCDITQAAVSQAETDYDNACRRLHKAKANDQPYEQQQQSKSEALAHLSQCRVEAKAASRKFHKHDEVWIKAWRALQKTEKTAESLLQKAKSYIPPPKPNAAVLESAMQHTASRDGLGWGFEHTALEQEKEYRKWLRTATKRLTPPPSDLE